jgi:hypothetical protein
LIPALQLRTIVKVSKGLGSKGFHLEWEGSLKKFLSISVLMNVALVAVLGLSWNALTAQAAGGRGGGVPAGNGDVNGDGAIDISDAVYLLSSLFLGGSALVAIECPPPAVKGLPATGQTKCYDAGGLEIDCASTDFPGQDGFYQTGCPNEGRFTDNGDGTVTDSCTGLMWQKVTADIDGNGSISNEDRINWQGALKYCDRLELAGHDDWRLPNVRELQSLIDYGRADLVIDPVFGMFGASGTVSTGYWSSSSSITNPGFAWIVDFEFGYVGDAGVLVGDGGGGSYVRAVRNAP